MLRRQPVSTETETLRLVSAAKGLPGSTDLSIREMGGREVIWLESKPTSRKGALSEQDGQRIASAARLALALHKPLVLMLSTSGAAIDDGIPALAGWGSAAKAISDCSGTVPVLAALVGPAVSGPALLLGLADYVVATSDSVAYLSGPSMVQSFTAVPISSAELGSSSIHSSKTGVVYEEVSDSNEVIAALEAILSFLPDSTDSLPPNISSMDKTDRGSEGLREVIPSSSTGSYDVRNVVTEIVDDGYFLEIRRLWSPHLVIGLARIGGRSVGILANQPMIMAGTLDIAAAQKGARFVRFCDAFNIPLITIVDTPGFLPGKDVEWRGMIRHGAELAFAYASCGTPRICLITRKAYGGAYIVMDSKGMGNDLTLAWPSAEIAVMGSLGAVQILYRRLDEAEQKVRQNEYEDVYLTPWLAAERGYVDEVIDPYFTRPLLANAIELLVTKQELLRSAKHANSPL